MPEVKEQTTATIDDAACAPEWKDILQQMILIRRFEEATEREFRKGKIGGYLHVYIGQEAVASGILGALKKNDAFSARIQPRFFTIHYQLSVIHYLDPSPPFHKSFQNVQSGTA